MSNSLELGPGDISPPMWLVLMNGRARGPYTTRTVQRMHRSREIDAATLVWQSSGWRSLAATGFAEFVVDLELPIEARRTPPAACAWMLACTPFLGLLAAMLMRIHLRSWGIDLLWIAALSHLVLAETDLFVLQRAGFDTSRMGPPAVVPAYLSLRARTLGQKSRHAEIWWAAFALALLVLSLSVNR